MPQDGTQLQYLPTQTDAQSPHHTQWPDLNLGCNEAEIKQERLYICGGADQGKQKTEIFLAPTDLEILEDAGDILSKKQLIQEI